MTEFLEIECDLKELITLQEAGFIPLLSRLNFYGEFLGVPLYSSTEIEKKVKEEFMNKKRRLFSLISTMLEDKKIIVGYTSPNKFKFFLNRIKKVTGITNTFDLGWFDNYSNVVGAILDFNVNIFGSSTFDITDIICHELVHYAFNKNNSTNILNRTLYSHLLPYYKDLIVGISNQVLNRIIILPNNNDKLIKSIKDLVKNIEKFNLAESDNLWNSYNIWLRFFKNIYEENDSKKLAQGMVSVYRKNFTKFEDILDPKLINEIEKVFRKSYDILGFKVKESVLGQETIFPSEIVAQSIISPNKNIILDSIERIKV